MSRQRILIALVLIACAASGPAFSDMLVRLKNGKTITVPVTPEEIDSITFGGGKDPMTQERGASLPPASPPVVPPSQSVATAPPRAGALRAVLQVGRMRELKLPSQAIAKAKNGDVIEIDAGDYLGDVAVVNASHLVIRGVGGRANLRADGASAEGKGIWVVNGDDLSIANIEFSGARVPDRNGAGIRAQGAGINIADCYFHDNEEGILAGDSPKSDIVIERSEFARNGAADGRSHAIYVNHVRSLTVRGSYIHHTFIGHLIKSRANLTTIAYNRLMDEADGNSSYAIDLPNGGRAFIIGNVIQQGPKTDNSGTIALAMEGPTNEAQDVYIVNNTFVNDHSSGAFFLSRSPQPAQIINNILVGPGEVTRSGAAAIVINNLLAERDGRVMTLEAHPGDKGNKIVKDARLADPRKYDYHLLPGSPAIGAAIAVPPVDNVALVADYDYVHPAQLAPRHARPLDLGALGYDGPR